MFRNVYLPRVICEKLFVYVHTRSRCNDFTVRPRWGIIDTLHLSNELKEDEEKGVDVSHLLENLIR